MTRVIRITTVKVLRIFFIIIVAFTIVAAIWNLWPQKKMEIIEPEDLVVENTGPPMAAVTTPAGPVELLRAEICLDIAQDRPVLTKHSFDKNVDYLFCFTEFSAPEKPVTILHRWRITGQEVFEKKMIIQGRRCRVWSKRHITSKTGGEGRVEILLGDGNILGSTLFMLL